MAYTTAASVKTYSSIDSAADDTLLTSLIAQAKATIDSHCHRTFEAAADTTRTFDAERDVDGDVLYLDEDLASITSITNGDGVVVAANEYTTEPRNFAPYYAIRLLASSSKAWEYSSTTLDPEDAISIVGRWAWSTTAPDDIVWACIRLATYLYRQRDNMGDMDRPILTAGGVLLPGQLPRDVLEILGNKPGDKYVRMLA